MDPDRSRAILDRFIRSGAEQNTLGLVCGRRRIGKSTLLERLASEQGGFYWEATRGEHAVHLARLGNALGEHLGVSPLLLKTWEDALSQLLRLGDDKTVPMVIDEFGYVLEAGGSIDSMVAAALGPAGRRKRPGRSRLILCGSTIAMMRALTAGEAPLRGRAGLELVMQPFDYRGAARHLAVGASRKLAVRVYAVIGGVIGYMTDMVDHDLPECLEDFDRWIAARVLSPAATLSHEATTLLAEEPTLTTGSPALQHSILGAIANGSITAGRIARGLRRTVSNLDPALKRLIAAGFVVRHEDPLRDRRPTYALADPFLQFHYAILAPHGPMLRARDPRAVWDRLVPTFGSLVRGPVFEEQVREWVRRYADPTTLGGTPDRVGPSTAVVRGQEFQLDVVAVEEDGPQIPSERSVLAMGEAKAGKTLGSEDLRRLETIRAGLGVRAVRAKLMLFAPAFTSHLSSRVRRREDVELIDLERLYDGS